MKKVIMLILLVFMSLALILVPACASGNESTTQSLLGDGGQTTSTTLVLGATTNTTALVIENPYKDSYRVNFVYGAEKTVPYLLMSYVTQMQESGAIMYGDGVPILMLHYPIDEYEADFPAVTIGEDKRAAIETDEHSRAYKFELYASTDKTHENVIKAFENGDIDFSDIESGEYYLSFNLTRYGKNYGEHTDEFAYVCFVRIIIE